MRLLIALGGNALLRRGEVPGIDVQRRNVARAVAALADVAHDHDVVVTHGNGPQIGFLAWQNESSPTVVPPSPLDVLGAESEGWIGYLLEQALASAMPGRPVATLLTQTEVRRDDPAFGHPTKPIGPVYTADDARRLAAARGWSIAADGAGWRRVVASPEPQRILETATIALLVDAGVLVVCAGGGGVPVVVTASGAVHGVEAVVDKDLAAALLARELRADALVLLTDVDAVYLGWNRPDACAVGATTPSALRAHAFAPGSMAPKVEAACRFVEATGRTAMIGRLDDARDVVAGRRGTHVRP